MPTKQPPTVDEILREIRLTTPAEYHDPFFDDPGGAIATYRGAARALREYSVVVGRSASRQLFITPDGFEPAGPGVRASQTVVLERTSGEDSGLVLAAGSVVTEGPGGRVYRSFTEAAWLPFDPDPLRSIQLSSDLIGEPGNLDFLADADGNLTLPEDPSQPSSLVGLADLSQDRSGTRGVLTVVSGQASTLTDDGLAPTFSPTDPDLYVRINFAGNAANIGRVLRITGYGVSTVEDPPGSGLFPRFVVLDDLPQPFLVSSAQADDGGVFTDFTAAAQSTAADDVQLLPVAPVVNDAFYFGGLEPFVQVELDVTTKRVGDLTLTWEYWDGAVWQPFLPGDVLDNTDSFSIEGVGLISFDAPVGWASTTVNGVPAFYIRARVSAFVSQAQQPLAGRATISIPNPLLIDPLDPNGDGQVSWTILDATDLGVRIVTMTAPTGGRDDDLGLKLRERGVKRDPFESDEQLRRRASRFPDVVSPELLERKILRMLEPFGLTAQIKDLGYDGPGYPSYTGLFWDVPTKFAPAVVGAWDLYGPGDAFPADKSMLPLSEAEARWHFFVCVPPPALGEFGAAWDEGPAPSFQEDLGTFVDSAWDYAFTDGYPWLSGKLYLDVVDCLATAKAGGIAFTLIQDPDLKGCP